jgi:1-acyl-sn-glycerol-3-phosphate acyltransferase
MNQPSFFHIIFYQLRMVFAFLIFMIFMTSLLIFSILTLRQFSFQIGGPALRLWANLTLKILGVQLQYDREPSFKLEIPRLMITNHQSTLDIIWYAAFAPNRFCVIGKKEVKFIPFLNLGWWIFKLYYLDRKNLSKAISTFQDAGAKIVEERRSLIVAPEGTRSEDGYFNRFKKGAFHLATEHHIPIYPIVVDGAFDLMPKGKSYTLPGIVKIKFLDPIDTSTWNKEEIDQHIEEVRNLMIKEWEALSGKKHIEKHIEET